MLELTKVELRTLSPNHRDLLLTIRHLDKTLAGRSLKEQFAEMFPPALLFGDDIRAQQDLYGSLRNFLNKRGTSIPVHSFRKIVIHLAHRLYMTSDEREPALNFASSITSEAPSIEMNKVQDTPIVVQKGYQGT